MMSSRSCHSGVGWGLWVNASGLRALGCRAGAWEVGTLRDRPVGAGGCVRVRRKSHLCSSGPGMGSGVESAPHTRSLIVFYRTARPSATGSAAGSEPPLAAAAAGAGAGMPGGPGVPAGMLVTPVPAVARSSGRAGESALVCGPGGGLASGDQVVLWHPVAVAPVKVKRDGSVLVDAWVPELARLGVLEDALGPGTIEAVCARHGDRKSTRLNSSHVRISYAVFCLKK